MVWRLFSDSTPSRILRGRELLCADQEGFSPDELEIVRRRKEGLSWAEVAEELGGTPEGIRKKHSRAIDRVSEQLGVESFLANS